MILALLLAQASAVDAERAFAADAQKIGQWTAFRKWAADDAVMFWPEPVRAQEKLKMLPDPPKSVEWQPARSFVSCDGTVAANTGPWKRPDGSIGYFSTIWVKQQDGGWKWVVDGGDEIKMPRFAYGAKPKTHHASCSGKAYLDPFFPEKDRSDQGNSPDRTLTWIWEVASDGSRAFWVAIWDGRHFKAVIDDHIAAPPKP